ncbi:MAG TPA: ABC transporter ATP-binding protein [Geminicoccaceae bacterium]|nr:ABC transporter ATP-binding protein [Geminicoccaceae bacterium]
MTALQESTNVLEVENLGIAFGSSESRLSVVEDLTFAVRSGELLALVGESGCGKSVTALAIMGLLPRPQASTPAGRIVFEGQDITTLDEAAMQDLRGRRIAMIFQEPMTALNPVMRIGRQIEEVLLRHRVVERGEARPRALELLRQVRIADPERRLRQYPHELSGGMRQRVMIAMALACDPVLLLADEPTTALDVTVQAQIMELIADLQRRRGTSVVLITHDLGIVAETADRVIVMYAGRVVETASVRTVLEAPRHPYTQGLIASVPRLGRNRRGSGAPLADIPGSVPPPGKRGRGCVFRQRCAWAIDACAERQPQLDPFGEGHRVACLRAHETVSS